MREFAALSPNQFLCGVAQGTSFFSSRRESDFELPEMA